MAIRRQKKQIGELKGDVLIVTGIVAAGFYFVVKPILNLLGDDEDSKEKVKELSERDLSGNPFSLQSALYQSYLQDTWGTIDPAKDFQFWQQMHTNYEAGLYDNTTLGAGGWVVNVTLAGQAIWDSVSFWTGTDYDTIKAVFFSMKDQLMVSVVTAYFYANFQADLLTFIKNGTNWWIPFHLRNGLNDTALAEIINYIDKLPELAS